ncbi:MULTISPECIES: hypothetical protein [unclassified Micromonospora]|uniref:sulfotransferase-like domain-containing protein n=1 Tax=unclassified Micromonospora TaxID=2617518 RepID=UPI001C24630F|nr:MULTISPECIES: hypothetical protein [unclassified Micromonospora]MBU8858602.1 hypothetical protein [Micromonospora sp. WMMB482]MDM4784246.1 hypothetical protein [Micromonospora sp. b486]
MPGILALWSAPRCRSTAFFRMMCERDDFAVLHEPFSYRAEFGRVEVDGASCHTETEVMEAIRRSAKRRPLFFKDTSDERYAHVLADPDFLARDVVSTFLIRHPAETIASYHRVNPNVERHQIGFEALFEMFCAVRDRTGRDPVVIDAEDLIRDPRAVVRAYSDLVKIPYREATLNWRPGHRREWRPSERWHQAVSASSGFHAEPRPAAVDVSTHPVLGDYLRHHLPFYEELSASRLRV